LVSFFQNLELNVFSNFSQILLCAKILPSNSHKCFLNVIKLHKMTQSRNSMLISDDFLGIHIFGTWPVVVERLKTFCATERTSLSTSQYGRLQRFEHSINLPRHAIFTLKTPRFSHYVHMRVSRTNFFAIRYATRFSDIRLDVLPGSRDFLILA
jgi:hypothetical protein